MRCKHAALLPALLPRRMMCKKLCYAVTAGGARGMACSSALCAGHADGDPNAARGADHDHFCSCSRPADVLPGCLHVTPGGVLAAGTGVWSSARAKPDAVLRRGEPLVLLGKLMVSFAVRPW